MLVELAIRGFALVDEATIPFGPGLTVLTGETGAGKSILVEALGCACGARAREESIRDGEASAHVTALFRVAGDAPAVALLETAGIDAEGGEIILRREIVRGGRGRAWINGVPVTVGQLRAAGDALVELHGQHESQTLLAPARHRDLLDGFAGVDAEREAVAAAFEAHARARSRREDATGRLAGVRERRAQLERELAEIDAVSPRAGEEERLEEERRALTHRAKLSALLDRALDALDAGDVTATERADRALRALREGEPLDPRLAEPAALVASALVALGEAAGSAERIRERLSEAEGRVDALIERLEAIARLRKRHGGSVESVLARREEIAADLLLAEGGDDAIEDLARDEAAAARLLAERSLALSEKRKKAAPRLAAAVGRELAGLGMRRAAFHADVAIEEREGGLAHGGRFLWTTRSGVDSVEFFLSPNPGEGRHPLARIASGGELSRVLLALVTALGGRAAVPVSVFDEVDAGVGADLAAALGEKLVEASRARQVFVITHFAQIAARAGGHLRVSKLALGSRTRVRVATLSDAERAEEIARMLGGEGEVARRHAHELLSRAADPGARAAGPRRGKAAASAARSSERGRRT